MPLISPGFAGLVVSLRIDDTKASLSTCRSRKNGVAGETIFSFSSCNSSPLRTNAHACSEKISQSLTCFSILEKRSKFLGRSFSSFEFAPARHLGYLFPQVIAAAESVVEPELQPKYNLIDVVRLKVGLGELVLVDLEKPLGITLEESPNGEIRVIRVEPGRNADKSGKIFVGDRIAAVSATFGDDLWIAQELTRVASAVKTRLGSVTLVLERKPPERSPSATYEFTQLIRQAGVERNAEQALAVLQEMKQARVRPDNQVLVAFVEVCLICDNFPMARKVLEEMQPSLTLEEGEDEHRILFRLYCRAAQLPKAIYLFSKMPKPTVEDFNVLINACVECGDPDRAVSTFEKMQLKGVAPDVVTYTTLVKAYGAKHDTAKALKVLQDMRDAEVLPNVWTYNSVMTSCLRSGAMDQLPLVFDELKAAGIKPTVVSWNIVINRHCIMNDFRSAFACLKEMKSYDVRPNVKTYTSLIKNCIKRRDLRQAEELFAEMKRRRVSPDVIIYACMIKGYGDSLLLAEASRMWDEMLSKRIAPNLLAYNNLIIASVNKGDVERAVGLFHSMRSAGIAPNVLTYTTLIDGYAKQKMLKRALMLFSDMRKSGVPPNLVTYGALMDACLSCGDLQRVSQLFALLKAAKLQPDIVIYTLMMKRFGLEGDVPKCLNVLKAIKDSGLEPSASTYRELIACLIHAGDAHRALKFLQKLTVTKKLRPDRSVFYCVFRGFGANYSRHTLPGSASGRPSRSNNAVMDGQDWDSERSVSPFGQGQSAGQGQGQGQGQTNGGVVTVEQVMAFVRAVGASESCDVDMFFELMSEASKAGREDVVLELKAWLTSTGLVDAAQQALLANSL